jgi:FAD synthase
LARTTQKEEERIMEREILDSICKWRGRLRELALKNAKKEISDEEYYKSLDETVKEMTKEISEFQARLSLNP